MLCNVYKDICITQKSVLLYFIYDIINIKKFHFLSSIRDKKHEGYTIL